MRQEHHEAAYRLHHVRYDDDSEGVEERAIYQDDNQGANRDSTASQSQALTSSAQTSPTSGH